MRVQCTNCDKNFRVMDSHGGKWGICSLCNHRFILPIPDPNRLLEWASGVEYEKLTRFISNSGAIGHTEDTISGLIKIAESRRWAEEERIRQSLVKEGKPVRLTQPDRLWEAAQQRALQRHTLSTLRELDPGKFEEFVADVFERTGLDARAIGGPGDAGVDVELWDKQGVLWGIVQCKRYAQYCRVTTAQVLEFAGAFLLRKPKAGFIVTTGDLTRHARKTAKSFDWLTVYSGLQLIEFAERPVARPDAASP